MPGGGWHAWSVILAGRMWWSWGFREAVSLWRLKSLKPWGHRWM